MRTDTAIYRPSAVAVETQDLEVRWKVGSLKPAIKSGSPSFYLAVGGVAATVVEVINREKSRLRFSTTGALRAICGKGFHLIGLLSQFDLQRQSRLIGGLIGSHVLNLAVAVSPIALSSFSALLFDVLVVPAFRGWRLRLIGAHAIAAIDLKTIFSTDILSKRLVWFHHIAASTVLSHERSISQR
jgi:hypothetical protein